ncbi:MAG TPA: pentapeptide repeat-containing protein, partial [Streptosporangiaceae bacterium]|nr:pentapeptide repeat-containing protein [Streptosporangiaceae bacterium]
MATFKDQDLTDAEFRECDLTRARLIGVVMQDAVIDGLVSNLVVNGVEVTSYVEAELDRHPVRLLIRSADPADLR